jgi:hypothetical protein
MHQDGEKIFLCSEFGVLLAERAQETGLAARSLRRASDAFDTHGMISLFRLDLRSTRGPSSVEVLGQMM